MKPYYEEDGITIYHGDCREVLPNLGMFGLLLTDPPYTGRTSAPEFAAVGNTAVCLHLASEHTDRALVFSGASVHSMSFVTSSIKRLRHNRILCWHNSGSNSNAGGPWRWDVILIHLFGVGLAGSGPGLSSMITTTEAAAGQRIAVTGHRASVPVGVMEHLYKAFAPDSVLDPFCGSGSSLLAVRRHGGTAVGIEIEERYCEIAAKRLSEDVLDLAAVSV